MMQTFTEAPGFYAKLQANEVAIAHFCRRFTDFAITPMIKFKMKMYAIALQSKKRPMALPSGSLGMIRSLNPRHATTTIATT
jgi:hypothetical protein